MPDQPQSPNSNRISAILQDLAQQRGQQGTPAPVGGPAPVNLPVAPTTPRPATPAPVAAPVAPMPAPAPIAPAPVAPAPRPVVAPPAPLGATPPPRLATPPAPRELPVVAPPKPATPPVPPPPAPVAPVVAPRPVAPAAPVAPAQPPLTSELRTMAGDIGQIQVGRPTSGVRPVAPVAPVAPAGSLVPPPVVAPIRPVAPTIAIPPEGSSGTGRKLLVYGVGALLVVGIIGYVASMFGGSDQVAEVTPTPIPTTIVTLAPQVKKLTTYFGNPSVTLPLSSTGAADDLRNAVQTAQAPAARVTGMAITLDGTAPTPKAFLEAVLIAPADLTAALGSDMAVLAYGQTEVYDTAGAKTVSDTIKPRLALVVEVTDASAATQAMQAWEANGLAVAGENIFDYMTSDRIVEMFSDGNYRNVPMRYWNFPYADRSLDWGIALASNGKSYLILTGSRESAFFSIDQLMQ